MIYIPPAGFIQFTGEKPTGYRFHVRADCPKISRGGPDIAETDIPGSHFRCTCVRKAGIAPHSEGQRSLREIATGSFESSRRRH